MVDIPEGTVTATAKLVGHGSSLKIEYAFFDDMGIPIKKTEESYYPAIDWESDPLNLMPYLNSITIDAWKIEGWRDEAADAIRWLSNGLNSGLIWLEDVVRGY